MLSRLSVSLALASAALLCVCTPVKAAYYAFYEDYVQYGVPACNATGSLYDIESVPEDLTDTSVVPVGFVPIIRQTIDATLCTEYEYCYGPNSGTIFNATAFVQCALQPGSSTMWNLSLVVFEGPVADDVDAMIQYAAAIPSAFLSELTTVFNVTSYVFTSGAFDACNNLTACFDYGSYASYTASDVYPGLVCDTDLFAQFACNAETTPPAISVTPSGPSSGAIGDPQLYGLLGQSFQVHGIDGGTYNLISAPGLQVNTRFVFLDSARCPSKQVVNTPCWSHAGSYMGALSMQVRLASGEVLRITVTAGSALTGLQAVQVNSDSYATGSIDLSLGVNGEVTVVSRSTHTVSIHTPLFDITADNSDHFVNLRLNHNVPLATLRQDGVHGLLGQTHSKNTQHSALKEVEGEVDDYFVMDGLHGADFMYNRFQQA